MNIVYLQMLRCRQEIEPESTDHGGLAYIRQQNDCSRTVRKVVLRAQITDEKFGRNTYGQTSAVRAIMLLCRGNDLQYQLCVSGEIIAGGKEIIAKERNTC